MALAPTQPPPALAAPGLPTSAPRRWKAASDDTLVRAAGRGDDGAIAAIHDRYRPALERYCRTLLLHRADAEDAAQSALAAALRALSDGRARPHALRAWLYKIAHREALAVLDRRPPAPAGPEALELLVDPREERTASRERLGELLDDLRALPERQRGALVLHELAGMPFAEVAETLSITPAAARQAAYEARTGLRARHGELQALFPAGPVLALAAGGGAAFAGGATATGSAGALGALGAWLAGAGAASKCVAVCAALGAIGAGSLTVTHPPQPRKQAAAVVEREAETRRAATNVDRDPLEGVRIDVRRPGPTEDRPRRERLARNRRAAAAPDSVPAAPAQRTKAAATPAPADVTDITVEESPTGGRLPDPGAPSGSTPSASATPAPSPVIAPAATRPSAPTGAPARAEPSSVGSGTVTGSPSDDVVSIAIE